MNKKNSIKNRTCYYFDDVVEFKDFDLDSILIDKKSCENSLVYYSYKTLIGVEPYKIDGFIRVYDGTRYLILFRAKKYDLIYNRIRYLIGLYFQKKVYISYLKITIINKFLHKL